MSYKCSLCDYVSNYKKDIIKHFNKKKKCSNEEIIPEIIETKLDLHCSLCNKTLSTKNSLNRHIISCKSKQESKINKLKSDLEKIEKILNNNTINDSTINNNIQII